jgi:chromosome segregation ATPase
MGTQVVSAEFQTPTLGEVIDYLGGAEALYELVGVSDGAGMVRMAMAPDVSEVERAQFLFELAHVTNQAARALQNGCVGPADLKAVENELKAVSPYERMDRMRTAFDDLAAKLGAADGEVERLRRDSALAAGENATLKDHLRNMQASRDAAAAELRYEKELRKEREEEMGALRCVIDELHAAVAELGAKANDEHAKHDALGSRFAVALEDLKRERRGSHAAQLERDRVIDELYGAREAMATLGRTVSALRQDLMNLQISDKS